MAGHGHSPGQDKKEQTNGAHGKSGHAEHGHGDHGHHGHDTKPVGPKDVVLGAIVFYLLTLGIYELVRVAVPAAPGKPDLLTVHTLHQIQISGGLFLLIWLVLGELVFKPFIANAEKREAQTKGAVLEAQAKNRERKELDEKLAAELRQARLRGIEERDRRVLRAKKRAQELVDESQQLNAGELQAAQSEIARLKQQAGGEIEGESQKLAGIVVDRALSAPAGQTIH